MNHARRSLFIVLLTVSASGYTQDTEISLRQALDSAMENNNDLTMAYLDELASRAKFKQTHAVFLPQIRVSYNALSTNNPLNAFGFKLQQQSITQHDFNPELLNDPSATQNFLTKAEWNQPLLNLDMMMMRKASREQVNAATFRSERIRQYVSLQVETAYAGLQLAQQGRRVMEESLFTIKSIYKSVNDRYEKGYLQKSDVLQVEVQVAAMETKLSEANSNVGNASDHLSLLMGTSPRRLYAADSMYIAEALPDNIALPANRADFLAMESAVSAQDHALQSGKMGYAPKVSAFGEYLINDNEAIGFGSNSYLIGAQVSWTLFNGMATRNKIEEQRIERDKARQQLLYQREEAQVEFNKALRQREDARMSLAQQELTVRQAIEALRIVKNRYDQGLVATSELLQMQALVSQQKLAFAQAVYQFNTTTAYLNFLTRTK